MKKVLYAVMISAVMTYAVSSSTFAVAETTSEDIHAALLLFIIILFATLLVFYFLKPFSDQTSPSPQIILSAVIGLAYVIFFFLISRYGFKYSDPIQEYNYVTSLNDSWMWATVPLMCLVNILLDMGTRKSQRLAILSRNLLYYGVYYAFTAALYYGMFMIYFFSGLARGA